MDPSMFLQYSSPSGRLPQESKLVTYMNRSSSTPMRSLNQGLGELSLDPSPSTVRKVLVNEYGGVMGYYVPAPPCNIVPEPRDDSPPSVQVPATATVHQENVGGTTYFYPTSSDILNTSGGLNSAAALPLGTDPRCNVNTPSAYAPQMYVYPTTHMAHRVVPNPGLAPTFYMPETIKGEIYQRNRDIFMPTDLRQYPDLPQNVEVYTDLLPLEGVAPHSIATSYRVRHRRGGDTYAMRRLHSFSSPPTNRLETWKQIDHPNIIRLFEYFTTDAFGDHSLVLVYDYHPASTTLMNKFLIGGTNGSIASGHSFHDPFSDPDAPRPYTHQKNTLLRAVATGALLPEAVLWSIVVQLTAALRAIHNAGLACRALDTTKVVMNGCRVRIAWCGVNDGLLPNVNDVGLAQQEDLAALGRLILSLACRAIHCENLAASIDLVARTYSPDFKNLILYLLSNGTACHSLVDLMPIIGPRFYTQLEALERRSDAFEDHLALEIDNSRLLRIMIKLGVVNERPELNMDQSWAETGDRYLLKLFRDYLFHSVNAEGRPFVDQAHLTYCLNQLDAGTDNKVVLMSRDEQSVLVVTYAELKHCLENSYDEVIQQAESSP